MVATKSITCVLDDALIVHTKCWMIVCIHQIHYTTGTSSLVIHFKFDAFVSCAYTKIDVNQNIHLPIQHRLLRHLRLFAALYWQNFTIRNAIKGQLWLSGIYSWLLSILATWSNGSWWKRGALLKCWRVLSKIIMII